ncbi:Vta1 like-domain-containing protein [Scleroderma yunnanense]
MSLGLPPVSVGLKGIAPFLQRAEELVEREPIIAYWCAYYAAQLGISSKAKDSASRTLLFDLLTALERLKNEIGPNDAVDMEAASGAYVENFALKVFKAADDEDRAGRATKATAKKFLAASNFFEVLKIFPKSEISETTEAKIRYAKWKAADIAKAFREGRKPVAGPAASEVNPDLVASELSASFQPSTKTSPPVPQPPTTPPKTFREPSPSTGLARSPRRKSPPPQIPASDFARANNMSMQREAMHDDETLTPGQWSTTATPGYDLAHEHALESATHGLNSTGSSKLRSAWVSSEMEGALSNEEVERDPHLNAKQSRERSPRKVHFSTDAGKITPVSGSPPRVYAAQERASSTSPPRGRSGRKISPQNAVTDLPPGFVPSGPPVPPSTGEYAAIFDADALPSIPPLPSSTAGVATSFISPVSPLPPRHIHPCMPLSLRYLYRFAISSLDYEDVEQARRELHMALALLGG